MSGYGLDEEFHLSNVLEKNLKKKGFDVTIINASVSGDTTSGGLNRLRWLLENKKIDIVNPANPVWDNVRGIIFCGIIMRGETSHYDLVTRETFRSIGCLALEFPDIFMVNNVICVDNENQLAERLEKTTKNNARSLKNMCKGIRSRAFAWEEVDPNDGGFS